MKQGHQTFRSASKKKQRKLITATETIKLTLLSNMQQHYIMKYQS